jgi:ribosomal protein S24E
MKILNHSKHPLLKREEIQFVIESEKSPTYEEIANIVSEKVGKPVENIDILFVRGSFGKKTFESAVYVYENVEEKNRIKVKTQKQRIAEKKAAEEARKAEEEAKKNVSESTE